MSEAQESGIIGEVEEEGFSVVFKFVDEFPSGDIRKIFSWLTVISWKYDGNDRSGMPPEEVNQRMIALEHVYPIEINFYDDPEWEDFRKILELFNRES